MLFDFQRPPAWDFMTKRTRNNKNALKIHECNGKKTVTTYMNIIYNSKSSSLVHTHLILSSMSPKIHETVCSTYTISLSDMEGVSVTCLIAQNRAKLRQIARNCVKVPTIAPSRARLRNFARLCVISRAFAQFRALLRKIDCKIAQNRAKLRKSAQFCAISFLK